MTWFDLLYEMCEIYDDLFEQQTTVDRLVMLRATDEQILDLGYKEDQIASARRRIGD